MKKLYRYEKDFGRNGYLESVFVAEDSEVDNSIGHIVRFGEVLGKHSNVYPELESKDIEVLSEDQDFIEKLTHIIKSDTICGMNPLRHIGEE